MIKIIFENKNLTLERFNGHSLKVKDLIHNLKRTLKIGETDGNFHLIDDERKMNEDEIIDMTVSRQNVCESKVLHMVETKNYFKLRSGIDSNWKNKVDPTPIEDLVMIATGATEKPKIYKSPNKRKNKYFYDTSENFEQEILQHLLERSSNSTERFESLRNILRAGRVNNSENEVQTTNNRASSRNAYFNYARRTVVQPDPILVENLKEMGFEEDRIKRVLIATSNDITSATEMLLNDTDIALNDYIPTNYYTNVSEFPNSRSNIINNNSTNVNNIEVNNNEEDNMDVENENNQLVVAEINEARFDEDAEVDDIIEMDQDLIDQIEREVNEAMINNNSNQNQNNDHNL